MIRHFHDLICDLDEGKVEGQLTNEMHELVRAVGETGKSGTVTLTITVKKSGQMMAVSSAVKTKLPKPALEITAFYSDEDGALRKDDPRQPPLRDLPLKPPTPIRTVGGGAPKPTTPEEKPGA